MESIFGFLVVFWMIYMIWFLIKSSISHKKFNYKWKRYIESDKYAMLGLKETRYMMRLAFLRLPDNNRKGIMKYPP